MKKTRKQLADEQGIEMDYFQDNIAWKLSRNPIIHSLALRRQKIALVVWLGIAYLAIVLAHHEQVVYATSLVKSWKYVTFNN